MFENIFGNQTNNTTAKTKSANTDMFAGIFDKSTSVNQPVLSATKPASVWPPQNQPSWNLMSIAPEKLEEKKARNAKLETAKVEAEKAKAKSDWQNSPLGIATETFAAQNLAKAGAKIGVDLFQGITRSIGSAGISIAEPFGGNDEVSVEDIKNPIVKNVYTGIFGKEPVKSMARRVAENELAIKDNSFAQNTGLSKYALPLAFGGVVADEVLNFTPMGGEGAVAKQLLKETTEKGALKILSKSKVPQDIAAQFAGHFAAAKTSKEVDDIMKTMKGVVGAKKIGEKAAFDAGKYAQEMALKQEVARTSEGGGIISKATGFLNDAKKKLVDFAAPIEDVLGKAQKEGKYTILPEYHITNQIDRVLRSPTIAGQFARDNGLEAVIKNTDNLNHLDQYLIAKQAKTVAARGIETGRDLAKDEQLIKVFAPKYEEAAKTVTNYSQKLLGYSVESGLISENLASKLKEMYPDYVPINRIFNEMEKTEGQFGSRAIASLSKQNVVKKLEGSKREIESPIKSLLEKTADAFKQGEKNKAARMIGSYAKLPGNPFQLRELAKGETAKNTISFLDNGVKKTFETTADIAAAAKSMNVQQLNVLGQIFATPVRIARIGITGINLPFILANLAKDNVTAIINSKNALKTSIANPAVYFKSLLEAVGHGKLYEEMAREGALGTSFDLARNAAVQTIESIRAGRSVGSRIRYIVKNPGDLLKTVENIVSRGEELTRIAQYKGTKEASLGKGYNAAQATIEAARAARENTVNFARRGEWGTVLNSAFLYLNAGIQGTRTFLRALQNRPLETATKLALVVFTPISAVTAWNLSDPKRKAAYDDIQESEKKNNLIIVPPNPKQDKNGVWNVIKIPLSQEINNIAAMPRRAIEAAFGYDPMSVKEIAIALAGSVSPINNPENLGSWASTLTPQAIRPTVEGLVNRNLYFGSPQVPASLENNPPEYQVRTAADIETGRFKGSVTSGTARQIAKLLKKSPIKVEEWIKGTFGGVGSQVLNASDMALAGLNIIPKDQIGGQNVAKAIVARFNGARGGKLDNNATDRMIKIIQNQDSESARLRQEAEILYLQLKDEPKDQANAKALELKQKNPKLYEKLKTIVENAKAGLDYNDRLMMQMSVTDGTRAKFIWETLKSLKTKEEKNTYVEELKNKKIISDNVFNQLKELKAKGY